MKGKARWLHHGLSALFLVGIVVAGYKYLSLKLMLEAWRKFSWPTLGVLLVLPALYLLLKAWRFELMLRTVIDGEVSRTTVMKGYAASQSASLLPGGFAARAAVMSQADVPMERAVGPVLANGGMDQFVLLVLGLFLATWYDELRGAAIGLSLVLALGVSLLVHQRSRAWIGKTLLALAGRWGHREKMQTFQEACWSLVDPRLLGSTFLLSLAADAMSYGILCTVVAALGLKLELWPLAAAFVIPTLLGRLSPLPAGAGVTEAGMIAFLANQTAMSTNEAAAATALMRIFDVLLPAFYGGLIYFAAWKGGKESITPTGQEAIAS